MKLAWLSRRGRFPFASVAACALAACTLVWAVGPSAALARPGDDTKAGAKDTKAADSIIFRNGNVVTCTVLEETETSVKVRLTVAGISTETTYQKSEILEVKRSTKTPGAGKDAAAPVAATSAPSIPLDKADELSSTPVDEGAILDKDGKPVLPGTLKVYVVEFSGEFGRDVSKTPVTEWMKDVLRIQPDVLIVKFNHTFSRYGEEVLDFAQMGPRQYDMLETARELDTLISDRIAHDAAFKTKPRMVAWVKKALGGAAFLPFTFPEIYYTSDGLHGGLGGLEHMFDGVGDKVAQEKQYSLRLKRAEGLAIKGGHDERIMRAMSRGDYVLSYRLEGGKAVFLERLPEGPDEQVLKDDGPVNEKNRDSLEDMVRGKGNDFLTLNANTAEIIGFSNGTADSMDDLLFKLGVTRNYAVVKTKADKIFKRWGEDVVKAEADIRKLFRDYKSVQIKAPSGFKERTAARQQRKKFLLQILGIAEKYEESLNPRVLGDSVENLMSTLRLLINDIDQEQRLDRPEKTSPSP